MHAMPSQERLTKALGEHFLLRTSSEQMVTVEVLSVVEGIAMTPLHTCYHAYFALPTGCWLPQDIYRLFPPGEEGWELLLTPSLPSPDGRHVLQAVFHMEQPE